jgi:hypothetical protein
MQFRFFYRLENNQYLISVNPRKEHKITLRLLFTEIRKIGLSKKVSISFRLHTFLKHIHKSLFLEICWKYSY